MPIERAFQLEALIAEFFTDLELSARPTAAIWGPLATSPYALDPMIEASTAPMSRRRVIGFSAGREFAGRAQTELGREPLPVPIGPGGAPAWPPGITGSISHTDSLACAVVMVQPFGCQPTVSIGIDVEQLGRVGADVASSIMSERERQGWQSLGTTASGHGTAEHGMTATFSLKEALYKAQYPLTQNWLGFDHVEVDPNPPEAGSFRATLVETESSPLDPTVQRPLLGRCLLLEDHVISVVVLQQNAQSA